MGVPVAAPPCKCSFLSLIHVLLIPTLLRTRPRKAFADEPHSTWAPSSLLTTCASVTMIYFTQPLLAPSQGSNPQTLLPMEQRKTRFFDQGPPPTWMDPSLISHIRLPPTGLVFILTWIDQAYFPSQGAAGWIVFSKDHVEALTPMCDYPCRYGIVIWVSKPPNLWEK